MNRFIRCLVVCSMILTLSFGFSAPQTEAANKKIHKYRAKETYTNETTKYCTQKVSGGAMGAVIGGAVGASAGILAFKYICGDGSCRGGYVGGIESLVAMGAVVLAAIGALGGTVTGLIMS